MCRCDDDGKDVFSVFRDANGVTEEVLRGIYIFLQKQVYDFYAAIPTKAEDALSPSIFSMNIP